MSNNENQKKVSPKGFIKKRLEEKEKKVDQSFSDSHNSQKESQDSFVEKEKEKISVDIEALVRDLMFNKYFHISDNEARPIAIKMIDLGSKSLCDVKWFLSAQERMDLAKFLSQKYGLD